MSEHPQPCGAIGPERAIMKNHQEKTRNMARSALASSTSVQERRRHIHKRERARTRAVLHRARDFVGDELDELEAVDGDGVAGYGPVARRDMAEMVDHRRSHDHLGALLRWAHHHFDHHPALRDASDPTIDRYFGSLLPDTLSGFHALQHIMFMTDTWRRARYRSSGSGRNAAEVRSAARWVLAAGHHAKLNDYIRHHVRKGIPAQDGVAPRPIGLLLGAHDIGPFVEELVGKYHFGREARLTIEFVDETR